MKKFTAILTLVVLLLGCSKEEDVNSNLKDGLIIHLPFSGNLNDISGQNNNGSAVGGSSSFTKDRFFEESQSLRLNTGQYVEIPDKGLSSLTKFTIYLEFYPRFDRYSVLVGKRAFTVTPGQPYNQSFNIAINDDMQVRASLRKAGQCQSEQLSAFHPELTSGSNLVMMDCWNYVACTFDGNVQKLYLNGKMVSQQTLSGVVICDTDPLRLGAWWNGDPFYFDGLIDEFRVYNRALSEAELKQLYKL